MIRMILLAATASLGLALGACGDGSGTADDTVAANDDLALDDSNGGADADSGAGDFAATVAASDMYETEAGKLASDKAQAADVKAFGDMLVTDHAKSTADLRAALAQTPTTMPVPELTAEQQTMLDALRSAGADDFDGLFLDQQVQAHTQALAALKAYEATGESQPLKDFAAATAPVIQAHLDKANALKQ